MNEVQFAESLRNYLAHKINSKYNVTTGESLLYKIMVDHKGKVQPGKLLTPSRGQLAFQTDLLIKKGDIPIIVCEIKYKKEGSFSTHDILTYSAKAVKHKQIYPYLRYGFVAGNTDVLSNRFFTHNEGFDFALVMPNKKPTSTSMEELSVIIKKQIKNAEKLLKKLEDRNRVISFNTQLEFKYASKL